MLILVSQLIENCFGLIKQKLESIIVLLVLGFPMLGFAQQSEFEFSVPPLPGRTASPSSEGTAEGANGFHQQLSQKHVSTPGLVPSLSISKAEETADPVVLLESIESPEPPRDLLMPVPPTAKSFGEPLINDLRVEGVQRKPESGVVSANAEMSIEESPLSTRGSFIPIQEDIARAQPAMPKFTADNLRSDFLPALNKKQIEATETQLPPPLDQPMRKVLMASEIPTHAPDEVNSSAPSRQANAVQLAGFTEAVYKKSKSTPATAKELISRYSLEQYENPVPGQPVNLVDFFRQPLTLDRRSSLVQQYWKTYFDWANYVASENYRQWLKQVPIPESNAEQALLAAVEAVVANQVMAAEIKLLKSQSTLAQFWPVLSQDSMSPIPNDLPLIQRYNTNYELYFSRQLVPAKFRGIDKVLPKMLALIEMRAEAVGYAKSAADRTLVPTQGMHLLTALEAGEILYTAERDLIDSVVSYNRTIGDYALSVATQPKSAAEVVEMLIAKVPVTSMSPNAIPPTVIPANEIPANALPANVIPANAIPAKAPPVKANTNDASNSVVSKPQSPTASIAKATDFAGQRATVEAQSGTTSVLQTKKEERIQDILSPPESDVISDRRPPPIGGAVAQPVPLPKVPLPKVIESGAGFSLSPANKAPILKSSDPKAPPAIGGFKPPTSFKTTPSVDENRFSKPPSANFKAETNPPVKQFNSNGFQPFGNKEVEVKEPLKTGGFKAPDFSTPGFTPANQK
ncbi:MAG: hypothetical protein P8L78_12620 [Mariniblastus sp.]|nr:hypothetical protein [Mariniblastus sp.]